MAQPSDALQVVALIHDSFQEYYGRLNPPSAALRENATTIAAEMEDGSTAFIARLGEVAIGCVVARAKGNDLYFGRLSVLPKFRGVGAAAQLVGAVEKAAIEGRHDGVLLAVRIALPGNQRFFARLGYSEIGRTAHAGFDHPTSIDMRKSIDTIRNERR